MNYQKLLERAKELQSKLQLFSNSLPEKNVKDGFEYYEISKETCLIFDSLNQDIQLLIRVYDPNCPLLDLLHKSKVEHLSKMSESFKLFRNSNPDITSMDLEFSHFEFAHLHLSVEELQKAHVALQKLVVTLELHL